MASAFSSVKLPRALVDKAREAAQPMRRSVASQIEYWATLGQMVEHTRLSVHEARTALEDYERAISKSPAPQSLRVTWSTAAPALLADAPAHQRISASALRSRPPSPARRA